MFPLWADVVQPVVRASGASRILEIGALRGETTALMLDALGPDAELHVIDPAPEFDPTEHEQKFPGRYVFHRDLSLNVLPEAPPFDVALIDGDHNWYTVYHELRHLAATSRAHGRGLPLLILHDVGWPYGRRDLYYAPEQIPEEHRQPHAKRGMTPHRRQLLQGGGMNITLDNALVEGGPRNGVRTALDDFAAEHDRPLRQVVLPIYFGIAIVAEQEMLDRNPELSKVLDRLESPEGTSELLDLAERIRLDSVVFEHNIGRVQGDRLTHARQRYLDLLTAPMPPASRRAIETLDAALRTIVGPEVRGVVVDASDDPNVAVYACGFVDVHQLDGVRVEVVRLTEAGVSEARAALDDAELLTDQVLLGEDPEAGPILVLATASDRATAFAGRLDDSSIVEELVPSN